MNDILLLARIRAQAADGTARAVRQSARLSLSEVAKHCGAVTTTISRWETGQRRPRGDAGLKYARLIEQLNKSV
jgi:DNA-binding transcriptional regulator YiaG